MTSGGKAKFQELLVVAASLPAFLNPHIQVHVQTFDQTLVVLYGMSFGN